MKSSPAQPVHPLSSLGVGGPSKSSPAQPVHPLQELQAWGAVLVALCQTKRNALRHSIQFGIAHGVWPLTLGYLRCPAEPFSASLED